MTTYHRLMVTFWMRIHRFAFKRTDYHFSRYLKAIHDPK